MESVSQLLYLATTWVLPLVLSLMLHEVAHGWMAYRLGDKTAFWQGRLSLNPKAHIDPIGTLLMPLILLIMQAPILFGWAKPVPVNMYNLKNPKKSIGLVALAGPMANLLLAIGFVLVGKLVLLLLPASSPFVGWVLANIQNGVGLSLALCIFNLLPILPLDGGKIVYSLLPAKQAYEYKKTEQYGFYILILLVFILPLIGINVIGWVFSVFFPILQHIVMIFI